MSLAILEDWQRGCFPGDYSFFRRKVKKGKIGKVKTGTHTRVATQVEEEGREGGGRSEGAATTPRLVAMGTPTINGLSGTNTSASSRSTHSSKSVGLGHSSRTSDRNGDNETTRGGEEGFASRVALKRNSSAESFPNSSRVKLRRRRPLMD